MERPNDNSTAVLIEVPEAMSKEQQRRLIQRLQAAMRNEGIEGRVAWCQSYNDQYGSPVFYIP